MSNSKDVVKGLRYALHAEGITVTLFEGPPSPKSGRAVWADATKILRTEDFKVADVPNTLEDDGEGENAGPKTLAAFGLQNLLTDRTSQVTEGPEKKLDAMLEYMEIFKRGLWRERKQGGGRKAKVDTTFALAVCRAKGYKDSQVSAVAAKLQQMDKETREQIRQLPDVQKAFEAIRQESEETVELDFGL